MQGISKSRHKHLVDVLLQFESLLKERQASEADMEQAQLYRDDIETIMANYGRLVTELAEQIKVYLELYDLAKIKFLGLCRNRTIRVSKPDTKVLPTIASY